MEKMKIFNYDEFISQKESQSEKESKVVSQEVNEGFLDSILKFFKGIFDLFNDKKVKKDAEDSKKYFASIVDDEDISDDEVEEEIDPKRVRKISKDMSKNIETRIETDEEKGIRTAKNLVESFSSWLGMLFIYEESLYMPLLVKMTKNPESAKRFTWVPKKYRENLKEWYKSPDCKPSPEILKAIEKIAKLEADKKKNEITKFSNSIVEKVAKDNDLLDGLKNQESDALDNVHSGLAFMAKGIIEGMFSIIKNTQDGKLSEVISKEIVEKRKVGRDPKTGRFVSLKGKDKDKDKSDSSSSTSRTRKGSKKQKNKK